MPQGIPDRQPPLCFALDQHPSGVNWPKMPVDAERPFRTGESYDKPNHRGHLGLRPAVGHPRRVCKERTHHSLLKLAKQAGLEQCQDELRTLLQRIHMYCTENHLPSSPAIVMDDVKYTGLSSQPAGCAPWERARVFDHEWTTPH